MKKIIVTLFVTFLIFQQVLVFSSETEYFFNKGVYIKNIDSAVFDGKITLEGRSEKKVKITVKSPKDNTTWYDVDYDGENFSKTIWLNEGLGVYNISILVNKTN